MPDPLRPDLVHTVDPGPDAAGRHLPAARVLQVRLRAQAAALQRADLEIRRGHDRGVHQARVACRRLRGALATFRPLVEREVSDPLRDELGWLARSLGDARDLHVVRGRLLALTEGEDDVSGPLLERIRAADWAGSGDSTVDEVLDSQRYVDLLQSLDAFTAAPPWTARAQHDAGRVIPQSIRRDWARLEDRVAVVLDSPPGAADDEALHDVRKSAKRLRYALEVAELLWRREPRKLRKRVRGLVEVLGERQDTVVTREALRTLAAAAEAAGESTSTHARLHRREELRAVELEEEFQIRWTDTVRVRQTWP